MPKKNRTAIPEPDISQKIMQFFRDNEGSIDTPRGISTWIDENIKTVRKALEELVRLGLLKAHRTSSTIGYSCPFDKKKTIKILPKFKKNK